MIVDAPPPVVELSGHVRNWLTRSGFPVRDFSTRYGSPLGGSSTAHGQALPGEVYIGQGASPALTTAAARLGRRGRLSNPQVEALGTLMHEGLHQMRYGRNPEGYTDREPFSPSGYEEAATEAVTRDLMPLFLREMYGDRRNQRDNLSTAYEPRVQNVRQLSVFGSGAKSWNDYKARVWRRDLLHASTDDRAAMIGRAQQARVAWGSRTGR